MRAPRLAFLASTSALIAVACSLDWSARPDIPDAGSDAANDGNETSSGVIGRPPPPPPPTDGPTVDCVALAKDVAAKKTKARQPCNLGSSDCTTGVLDECNCEVPVTKPAGNSDTDAFAAAALLYKTSCTPNCSAGCSQAPKASWACLQSGTTIACQP